MIKLLTLHPFLFKALWDKTLEFRFLLQKAFSSSNKLPQVCFCIKPKLYSSFISIAFFFTCFLLRLYHGLVVTMFWMYQEPIKSSFCTSDKLVNEAYSDLVSSCKETLDSMLELQEVCFFLGLVWIVWVKIYWILFWLKAIELHIFPRGWDFLDNNPKSCLGCHINSRKVINFCHKVKADPLVQGLKYWLMPRCIGRFGSKFEEPELKTPSELVPEQYGIDQHLLGQRTSARFLLKWIDTFRCSCNCWEEKKQNNSKKKSILKCSRKTASITIIKAKIRFEFHLGVATCRVRASPFALP